MELVFHGEGLHDMFYGEIDATDKWHLMKQFIAHIDNPATQIIREKNSDDQNNKNSVIIPSPGNRCPKK